jgi:hypothetical protein
MTTITIDLGPILERIHRDGLVKDPDYDPSTEPDYRGIADSARWVVHWIGRMAEQNGGTVYGYGHSWDWGQALCVEQYGPDWNLWPQENPTLADVHRARAWEKGDWPEWAVR